MRIILIAFMVLFIGATTALAQPDAGEAEGQADSLTQQYGLAPTVERIQKGKDSEKLAILYRILSNTPEVYIHRMRGAEGNKTYLHKDGHREVVFDENDKRVEDGINNGSYNFFHPEKQPLKHFLADIHPWIMWGASAKDPTTKKERIRAYVEDMEIGIRASLKQKKAPVPKKWDSMGQTQVLALFMRIIEEGEAGKLFGFFKKGTGEISDKEMIDVILRLEKGFNKVL